MSAATHADPEVAGVTCHVAYFEHGQMDCLQNDNWFEDPSNASIACRQTKAITTGDIDESDEGEAGFPSAVRSSGKA